MHRTIQDLRRKYQRKITHEEFSKFETIYHYTSPSALLEILKTGKLWFSDIAYVNDESESNYTYKMMGELLSINETNIEQEFYIAILTEVENRLTDKEPETLWGYTHKKGFFIASFSNDRDNLSLWNYYTKNQNMAGYNIGFNKNIIHKISRVVLGKSPYFVWGNVLYDQNKQKTMLSDALLDYNKVFISALAEEKKNVIDSFLGLLFVLSLFFKQEFFKSENEYRIVIDNYIDPIIKHDCAYENKFREINGFFVPYIETSFEKEDIEGITISPTIRQEYYEKSVQRMLLNLEYFKALKNVKKSEIPLRY